MASRVIPDGTVVYNKYRVLKSLGEGGMNRVYLVADFQGKPFAMKVTRSPGETGTTLGEITEKFYREVEILTKFPHENLPALEDYFTSGGEFFLVEEYIDGISLEDFLSRSLLGENETIELALMLCDVLTFLHRRGIIFRDLKPANIVVTAARHLKLIDFDIARFYRPGKAADTVALGTPGYAAPETYGKSQSNARSDIYSLGATLHHLLTGINPQDRPFHFEPVKKVRHDISPGLAAIIEKALRHDPRERYPSASSMKKDLERIRPAAGQGKTIFQDLLSALSLWASQVSQWSLAAPMRISRPELTDHLLHAVQEGNISRAKRLIEEGCPLNGCDYFRNTPLHLAAQRGDRPMAELLINLGARLDLANREGMTPRDLAFFSGSPEIEKILARRNGPLLVYDPSGMMRIHKMAAEGNIMLYLLLYKEMPNEASFLNLQDGAGRTPLHYAIENNRNELAVALINNGARLDIKDRKGDTPLHLLQNFFMLSYLYECCYSSKINASFLNVADREGKTPLYNAVVKGERQMVKFLVSQGADINCITRSKDSLIHGAIASYEDDIARLLISKGIKLNQKNSQGKTPLMLAVEWERWEIAKLLVENRAGINMADSAGKTPLMAAIEKGKISFVEKLIKKGAEVKTCDNSGMTALHYAAEGGSRTIIELLLKFRARTDAADHQGRTPEMVAQSDVAALLHKH
ncbi:MAG: ankyrin repeat domain-containing protein [Candidatus Eremiobacteraeota bacterium]|nr:ankyrin repeat domain-containing protein [Candidatus Eremiobacteraeota bacterium]